MTKTTTTERFEDGELVERVTVVEDDSTETPQAPPYRITPGGPQPNTNPYPYPWHPNTSPNTSPYIGDPIPNTYPPYIYNNC